MIAASPTMQLQHQDGSLRDKAFAMLAPTLRLQIVTAHNREKTSRSFCTSPVTCTGGSEAAALEPDASTIATNSPSLVPSTPKLPPQQIHSMAAETSKSSLLADSGASASSSAPTTQSEAAVIVEKVYV